MDYIRGMSPRPPSRDAERLFRRQFLLLGLLVLAIGGNVWLILAPSGSGGGPVGPLHDVGAEPRPVQASMGPTSDEERTITAFNLARQSVVGISTGGLGAKRRNGQRVPIQIPRGTGSGFVWDAGGWIVTNWHVVKEGSLVRVTLAGGELREGVLVGASAQDDLAVIKIDPTGLDLVPLAVGTSHDLRIGQSVLAIGNPFGLDGSLSKGVIRGLNRLIKTDQELRMEGVIQTDAAINPGNSGGALLDISGRLIGINTAIHSQTNGSSGVGFAVPVDLINRVVPKIIAGEMPVDAGRAVLGILMLDDGFLTSLGLEGVIVSAVLKGGGAEQAGFKKLTGFTGLKQGSSENSTFDRIIAIDRETITNADDLLDVLGQRKPGDQVQVTFVRDGETQNVGVTLGSAR